MLQIEFSNLRRGGTGKYVLFELADENCLQVQIFTNTGIKLGKVFELHQFKSLVQYFGYQMLGIYQAEHYAAQDGQVYRIPACVVPQRAKMVTGGHDFDWSVPGDNVAYRLTIPLTGVKNLQLLKDRDGLPTDKVVHHNFDPARLW